MAMHAIAGKKDTPLHQQVREYLSLLIRKGKEGDRLPTQAALCAQFGVSHITVRRAFKDLEDESLLLTLPGRGTFIQKRPSVSRTIQVILVLPPRENPEEDAFLYPIVTGAIAESSPQNLSIHVFPDTWTLEKILRLSKEFSINAVMWIAPSNNQYTTLKTLHRLGFRVMVINRIEPDLPFSYVSTDHAGGAETGTSWLLQRGHTRIGFVGMVNEISAFVQRRDGFLRACGNAGITVPEKAILTVPIKGYQPLTFGDVEKKLETLFAEYSPTALLISSVTFSTMVLDWMRKKGLKPMKDVEIAVFDEIPAQRREKKFIHEIVQPLKELGVEAVRAMAKNFHEKKERAQIILHPHFFRKRGK